QVSVLAVGNGQAALFRSPQGAILVDAGPSPALLSDNLGQIPPPWQATRDLVAITAPGLGHIAGFTGLNRAAGTLLIPDAQLTGSAWRAAAYQTRARRAPRGGARGGH